MASVDLSKYKLNLQPSPYDRRDFPLEGALTRERLPTAATLSYMPPIRDQGQEGSCWGFSGTAAREALLGKHGNITMLSPAFLYWQTRHIEGDESEDSGSNLRDGMRVLKHIGVCSEPQMPYWAGHYRDRPSTAAIVDAKQYRIGSYHRLRSDYQIKYAIAHDMPVVLGTPVYQGWMDSEDGHIPMPVSGDPSLGGHAILVAGYHDSTDPRAVGGGVLVLNNSWGTEAGHMGQYYLPYAYAFNPAIPWFEAWTMDERHEGAESEPQS